MRLPGAGPGFRLLAVWWGKVRLDQWVFSTDPLDRRRLDSLAAALQQAEVRRQPQHPPDDPWYNGAAFAHTLVAPPLLWHAPVRSRSVGRRRPLGKRRRSLAWSQLADGESGGGRWCWRSPPRSSSGRGTLAPAHQRWRRLRPSTHG